MVRFLRKIKENWGIVFVGMFLIISLMYVISNGQNIYISVHDYLDSHPAWRRMMSDNSLYFTSKKLVPMLGGIDRNYLFSEYKVESFVFMIFPTFTSIIIIWFLKICLSIIGFAFLSKSFGLDYDRNKNEIIIVGFFYGILPIYPGAYLSFAIIPLVLSTLIKLNHEFKWKYVLGLFVFMTAVDFSTFGIFICGYVFIYIVINSIAKRKINERLICGLCSIMAGLMLTEWRLFYIMLIDSTPTIKSVSSSANGIKSVLNSAVGVFVDGQYHCEALHKYVVMPTCLVYLLIHNVKLMLNKQFGNIVKDKFNALIFMILFNSLVYGLNGNQVFREIIAKIIPPLAGFSFARTAWFNPFIWYFAFLLAISQINKEYFKIVLCIMAFLTIVFVPSTYNNLNTNIVAARKRIMNRSPLSDFTYNEFYSEDLFSRIKAKINYDNEWSVAYGFHPAILEYNGISTLDGYLSYYPLEYKKVFRKLIEPDFVQDKENESYFDKWGGRAYIFSEEVEFYPNREIPQTPVKLKIDQETFGMMGGRYVFSLYEISNSAELSLKLVDIFEDIKSPYKIYLYLN